MSDPATTITVDSTTILAACAIVYGGLSAAIGYLWRAHQDLNGFIRGELMKTNAAALHREKVHHWMLSHLAPDLLEQAEREIGDLEGSPEVTATLPVAKGHASRKRPAVRTSGEHRVASVLIGLIQVLAVAAMGCAGLFLLLGPL